MPESFDVNNYVITMLHV